MHIPVVILAMSFIVLATAEIHPDDYYAKFNNPSSKHTMVKYKGFGKKCLERGAKVIKFGPVTEEEKQSFLKYHNDYRRKVAKGQELRGSAGPQPGASNMIELTWDDELAAFAQRWAEQCPDGDEPHDKNAISDTFSSVGQNMFSDTVQSVPMFGLQDPPMKANVAKAVKFWTMEAAYMDKNKIAPFDFTPGAGHYTQIVWADSEKLGCGFVMTKIAELKMFYTVHEFKRVVICNFGQGGNANGLDMYRIGKAGSECPPGTSNNDGLCS